MIQNILWTEYNRFWTEYNVYGTNSLFLLFQADLLASAVQIFHRRMLRLLKNMSKVGHSNHCLHSWGHIYTSLNSFVFLLKGNQHSFFFFDKQIRTPTFQAMLPSQVSFFEISFEISFRTKSGTKKFGASLLGTAFCQWKRNRARRKCGELKTQGDDRREDSSVWGCMEEVDKEKNLLQPLCNSCTPMQLTIQRARGQMGAVKKILGYLILLVFFFNTNLFSYGSRG